MAKKDFVIENDVLIKYTGSNVTVRIPEGVIAIKSLAFFHQPFSGPSQTTAIVIPNSVKTIEKSAVVRYGGLETITIPPSVCEIEQGAFHTCPSLTSIEVKQPNAFYHSQDHCLIETAGKILLLGCRNSMIPEDGSVTVIGRAAFAGCKWPPKIHLPAGIISIKEYAFSNCYCLQEVTIENGCLEILEGAFAKCNKLKRLTIPASVTTIGEGVFAECENVTVCAPAGSFAESYAKENGLAFIAKEIVDADRKTLENHTAFALSIDALSLSAKTVNCLQRAGLRTVAELVNVKESDVLTIRGIGKIAVNEIKSALDEHDLFLSKW